MRLQQQLHQTALFMSPANLAKTKIVYKPTAKDTVLLVIDVQKIMCDPESEFWGTRKTEKISQKIASLLPAFRKAGVKVCPVYFPEKGKKIDHYAFTPSSRDKVFVKNTRSAFASTAIDAFLRKNKKKSVLICGFNLSACVYETAMDAKARGFDVTILTDLTGNDKSRSLHRATAQRMKEMTEKGIKFKPADSALSALRPVA